MNTFVADPEWGGWIVAYFYLGGIAAGAYFASTLIELTTGERGRPLALVGYTLAVPLIALCGVFLTLDLGRPERFWHMLFRSGSVHQALDAGWPWTGAGWSLMAATPFVKPWSPMSLGSWGLALFGLCATLSLIGAGWPDARWTRWLRSRWVARPLQVVGCLAGFFVASYTGVLLAATNQPLWSDTAWLGPLFLASAASTGLAAMLLLARRRVDGEMLEQLEVADRWILTLELGVFLAFLLSLGGLAGIVWTTTAGKALIVGTLGIGVLLPLGLHLTRRHRAAMAAAFLALVGGFLLRYGVVYAAPEILRTQPALRDQAVGTPGRGPWPAVSPEDGRQPGERGADPLNRPAVLVPRGKLPADTE